MSHNTLDRNTMTDFGRRQGEFARTKTMGASFSEAENEEVTRALFSGGFNSKSAGSAAVLLAYARFTTVRDAVHAAFHETQAA